MPQKLHYKRQRHAITVKVHSFCFSDEVTMYIVRDFIAVFSCHVSCIFQNKADAVGGQSMRFSTKYTIKQRGLLIARMELLYINIQMLYCFCHKWDITALATFPYKCYVRILLFYMKGGYVKVSKFLHSGTAIIQED